MRWFVPFKMAKNFSERLTKKNPANVAEGGTSIGLTHL